MKGATQSSQGHTSFMCSSNVRLLVLQSTEGEELVEVEGTEMIPSDYDLLSGVPRRHLLQLNNLECGTTWLNKLDLHSFTFFTHTHSRTPHLKNKTRPDVVLFLFVLIFKGGNFWEIRIFIRIFFGRSGQTS